MTSIINKLLGKDDDKHSHDSHSHTHESKSQSGSVSSATTNTSTGGGVVEGRVVERDGVNIRSTVSSDTSSTVQLANQQKLNDLVTRLGATHSQIDEYARTQTEKIDAEIQREIDAVLARTRTEQDNLLRKANEHTAQIDSEYRARLQKMVEEVDATKAKRIAEIEKELNDQQAGILKNARNDIDQLNKKAANLKIGVLNDAQARAAADAKEITTQAANFGQASTVHQSTGTTTIKTEVSAATHSKQVGSAAVTTEARTVETARAQSHQSATAQSNETRK